jgi:energy-converting hydrogenase B subunit D
MTSALQAVVLALAAVGGLAVVLVREPFRQAMVASLYGLVLVVLFTAYQAPDVALSAVVVGAVALPLMVLLALAKIRGSR